jgi:putative hydrolase of the HAD superfamily
MTQGRFRALLSRDVEVPTDILNARLLETERRNLPT